MIWCGDDPLDILSTNIFGVLLNRGKKPNKTKSNLVFIQSWIWKKGVTYVASSWCETQVLIFINRGWTLQHYSPVSMSHNAPHTVGVNLSGSYSTFWTAPGGKCSKLYTGCVRHGASFSAHCVSFPVSSAASAHPASSLPPESCQLAQRDCVSSLYEYIVVSNRILFVVGGISSKFIWVKPTVFSPPSDGVSWVIAH